VYNDLRLPSWQFVALQPELLRNTARLSTVHTDRDLGAVSKFCAGIISTETWTDSKQTSHKSFNGHIHNNGQGET
jgi:hypothetical protein